MYYGHTTTFSQTPRIQWQLGLCVAWLRSYQLGVAFRGHHTILALSDLFLHTQVAAVIQRQEQVDTPAFSGVAIRYVRWVDVLSSRYFRAFIVNRIYCLSRGLIDRKLSRSLPILLTASAHLGLLDLHQIEDRRGLQRDDCSLSLSVILSIQLR